MPELPRQATRHYQAIAVACPRCAARPHERCRRDDGEMVGVHRERDRAYNQSNSERYPGDAFTLAELQLLKLGLEVIGERDQVDHELLPTWLGLKRRIAAAATQRALDA